MRMSRLLSTPSNPSHSAPPPSREPFSAIFFLYYVIFDVCTYFVFTFWSFPIPNQIFLGGDKS